MGVMLVGKMTVGFVLFMELTPEQNQVAAGILAMSGFPIAMLLSTAMLAFITQDVLKLLQLGFFLNLLSMFLCFILPESPQWLVS